MGKTALEDFMKTNPQNVVGTFYLDSVSEYKTAGYGFVEQTDPFLGKFLNVKKDAEMYVPRILVTKTKNAINQAQKN